MADRTRGPRRQKIWSAIPGINLALTGAGTSVGGGLQFASADTILRCLGEYLVINTGTITGGDAATISVGLGVVSADAFSDVGASAMPDPGSEPQYPWLFWAEHKLFYPSAGAPLADSGNLSVRQRIDVKSMRKMSPRQTLAVVVQYADVSGTPPIQVLFGQTRVLIALP